jgi:hypothetical protein
MTFMPPGKNNPIGNTGDFKIGGGNNGGSAVDILRGIGSRLQARSMAQGNARAIIESARIQAATEMTVKQMEIQAAAEATQLDHERKIKLARINTTQEIRKAKAENELSLQREDQAAGAVQGVLDVFKDNPDYESVDFRTERGATINVKRRKQEASSEDSEDGSFL